MNRTEAFITSGQASILVRCSLRQLQYWREQSIITPTVDATGRGRCVYYRWQELSWLKVMGYFCAVGLDFATATYGLDLIRDRQRTNLLNVDSVRYFLQIGLNENPALQDWSPDLAMSKLVAGYVIVPVWLDLLNAELERSMVECNIIDRPN